MYLWSTSYIYESKNVVISIKQSGAVEACWAHNPEVRGSKPRSAMWQFFLTYLLIWKYILQFNPLNTKRRLLYLKTQFVPRSKHFVSVIKTNQIMIQVAQVAVRYKTHKYSVGRTYNCWMVNCWCITWPVGFKRLIHSHKTAVFTVICSLFFKMIQPALGAAQPLFRWVTGSPLSLCGIKRSERENDHSSLSGAQVKNWWNHIVTLVCLHVLRRDNFTFTFTFHVPSQSPVPLKFQHTICFFFFVSSSH